MKTSSDSQPNQPPSFADSLQQLNVSVPGKIKRELKTLAAQRELNMYEAVTEALMKWIEENKRSLKSS